jgi:hypothetical protein
VTVPASRWRPEWVVSVSVSGFAADTYTRFETFPKTVAQTGPALDQHQERSALCAARPKTRRGIVGIFSGLSGRFILLYRPTRLQKRLTPVRSTR